MSSKQAPVWAQRLPTVDEVRAALAVNPVLWLVVQDDAEVRHLRLELVETVQYRSVDGAVYGPTEGHFRQLGTVGADPALGARFQHAPPQDPYAPPRPPPSRLVFTTSAVELDGGLRIPYEHGRVTLLLLGGVSVRAWYDAPEEVLTVKVVAPDATRLWTFHEAPPWTIAL